MMHFPPPSITQTLNENVLLWNLLMTSIVFALITNKTKYFIKCERFEWFFQIDIEELGVR